MKNIFSRLFSNPEIIEEQVIAYRNKLPKAVSVAFGKDHDLLIGRIIIEESSDPIYIQARNPKEFNKMLNEAVYVAFDIKSDYISFFHRHGDRFIPTPEAEKELYALYGKPKKYSRDLQSVMRFVESEAAFAH